MLVRLISAAVAALAAAITCYIPYRLLPAAGLSGALGMLVLSLVQAVGVTGVPSQALAAFVVGLSGYVLANAQRALPLMVVVPGILSLLPGLTLYPGLLELGTGQASDGIVSMADAGAPGLAIAAAVLVAEMIGQPVWRRTARRGRALSRPRRARRGAAGRAQRLCARRLATSSHTTPAVSSIAPGTWM